MLSVATLGSASAAENYYEHLAGDPIQGREDYYAHAGSGAWVGQGAQTLGLVGSTTAAQFGEVARGYSPATGEPLVQRPGEDHRAGWDFTFSAPKSVSAVWAVASATDRAGIERAHDTAVRAGLDYLERTASFTRRGSGGLRDEERREPAGLTIALYQHGTSRNQDPQLHTHSVVMNVGTRADGTTGALDSRPLFQSRLAAGHAYQAELASELRKLGYAVERGKHFGIEIVGVPLGLREGWSSRRVEIEAVLQERGVDGARPAEVAALSTRTAKTEISSERLREVWREQAAALTPEFSAERVRGPHATHGHGGMPSTTDALSKLTEHASVFRQRDADRLGFEAAQIVGLTAREAEQWAHSLTRAGDVVKLEGPRGEAVYTTREILRIEERILERGQALARADSYRVSGRDVEEALVGRPMLSAEQRKMVEHVTSPARIAVVEGQAGTGKSFALGAAREAWERAGYEVRGAALAGKAAEGLETGSGIKSTTVARILGETAPWVGDNGRIYPASKPLRDKTVLVVDEAGMIGSRQLDELLQRAERSGAKVVLVGDSRQLQPIEAGAPFRELSRKLGAASLSDIRRQDNEADRQAVRDLASGHAQEAIENLSGRGRVHVSMTADQAREHAARQVIADLKQGKNSLAVASTRAEVRLVNAAARAAAKEQGVLQGIEAAVQTTVGAREFAVGDRVVALRNDIVLNVKNGDFGTVKDVQDLEQGHAKLTVQLDRGGERTIDSREYASIDHGYAATAHKSQGATVDRTHIVSTGAGLESREWAYVAGSRAREQTHVHTDTITFNELGGRWGRARQAETSTQFDRTPSGKNEWLRGAEVSRDAAAGMSSHETSHGQRVEHEIAPER